MNNHKPDRAKSNRRRWLAGAGIAAILGGTAAWVAHAGPSGEDGFCRTGWHGRHGGWHGPEDMAERLSQRVERVFRKVGASDEQVSRAQGIVRAAAGDLKPLAEERQSVRANLTEILTADTIDRTRLDQQRAKLITDMQTASERVTRTLADLAEVLTPEQRREVAATFRHWREENRHG